MSENIKKTGGISVETNHIFPIIKKWLYSEKDIFLREIVSNAQDAVTKLKRLSSLGQIDLADDDFKITVTLDADAKTLTVEDNGIGMTEGELEKYICNIALSGALDFINKYEGEDSNNGIIGHFGLGFYSSFMVSDTVEVETKSYDGSPAVKWVCGNAGDYEISESNRETRGTAVIMHISDAENEYLSSTKITSMLQKYCSFMPTPIFFVDANKEDDDGEKKDAKAPEPINDSTPLWQKNPSDCTEEEYLEFYRKVFGDWKEPLFYIHINADYPLNFKGILYFPKLGNEYESIEGQVKLYYNQVFVADNIKEVIPEYLVMLKGVLDCPELPLNVSRSYLQNNSYISKVSAHIVKKVCDKLSSLCENDREKYEKIWSDIKVLVEYASLRDNKFFSRTKNSFLLELTDKTFVRLTDLLPKDEDTNDENSDSKKEKKEPNIYYTADPSLQAQYISMLTDKGLKVAVFDRPLDTQFMSLCEREFDGLHFKRVDSSIADELKENGNDSENEQIAELFKKVSGDDKLKVKFSSLNSENAHAIITVSEESRRLEEMMKLYDMTGGASEFPTERELVINTLSPVYKKLVALTENGDTEKSEIIAKQTYKLSLLSQKKFSSDEMTSFLNESFALLTMI